MLHFTSALRSAIVLTVVFCTSTFIVFGQAPRTFSYQGTLTDQVQTPYPDSTYRLMFALYNGATGGTPVWQESHDVSTIGGVFDVTLGVSSPLTMQFDKQMWLGITLSGNSEMLPRTPLVSTPYSLYSELAATATSLSPNATGAVLSLNGASGNLTLQGGGKTTVSQTGSTILVSSIGGVDRIDASDGSLTVINPNGPITSLSVADGGIITGKLADGSVSTSKLSDNAVTSAKVSDGAIITSKLTDGSVTTAKVNDGSITNVKINSSGATAGQALTFNGTNVVWGAPVPSGAAGGDLTGNYPNPSVAANAITTSKLADGSVTTPKLVEGSVTSSKVSDGAITSMKLNSAGATAGQALTFNGTNVVWGSPSPSGAAGGDLSGNYPNPTVATGAITSTKLADGSVTLDKLANGSVTMDKIANAQVSAAKVNPFGATVGQTLVYNGTDVVWGSPTPGGAAGGDLTGTYPNPSVASNAITSSKLADGSVTTSKVSDGAITTAKVNTTGATSGQALTFNGTSAVWGSPSPSGAAGGDLSGTYPNPSVAVSAITTNKLADGSVTTAKVNTTGATNGQALTFNGTGVVWGSPSPSGAAGGDLTGTYPNPSIAVNAITTAKLADGSVTTSKVSDGAITSSKVNTAGATNGQALTFNGTNVVWGSPSPSGAAGGDLSGTYPNPAVAANAITTAKLADGSVTTSKVSDGAITTSKVNTVGATSGQALTFNGTNAVWGSPSPSGAAGGDLSGNYPNPTVATNAITSAKILDGNVTTSKLADGSVTNSKVNSIGATSGQALTFNGTNVVWGSPTPSGDAGGDLSGTYPNPTVGVNAITTAKLADGSVTTTKVKDGAITTAKVNSAGATSGQALTFNGTNVVWGSPSPSGVAGGDLSGNYPNPTVATNAITTIKLADGSVTTSKVNSTGATSGQALTFDGTTVVWGSPSPSGAAGGDLTGTYPNPTVATNAITTPKIADGSITTSKVNDGAITTAKVNSTGATGGQALTFDGTNVVWGSPSPSGAAGGDLTGNFPNPSIAVNAVTTSKILDGNVTTAKLADASVTNSKVNSTGATSGQALTFNGTNVVWGSPSPSGAAGGDLTGTYPNPTVAANAITTPKIADASVTTSKVNNGAITTAKVNSTGATGGQALTFDGTNVVWGSPSPSGVAGGDLTGNYPNPNIAANAVTTPKILDGNVTTAKLADASVTNSKVNSAGASSGQALTFNGTTVVWGSPTPSGAAGGDLTGTYPNPTVAANAISTTKIADGSVTSAKVSSTGATSGQALTFNGTNVVWGSPSPSGAAGGDLTGNYPNPAVTANAITTVKLADASVTTTKVNSTGATSGQALTFNGTSVVWGSPSPSGAAGGDLSGTYPNPSVATNAITTSKIADASVTSSKLNTTGAASGQALTFNGTNVVWGSPSPSGAAGGDLAGNYPNPSVAANAITTSKIADASVTTAKVIDGAITTSKVNTTGATSGQALTYNGTAVVWGSPSPSGAAGGDLTGTYPNPTLVSTAVIAGNYGSATQVPVFNVDSKGRITGVTNTAITASPSGAAGGDLTGTYPNPTLTATAVTAGSYGSATQVPVFNVDSKGRITGVTNTAITASPSGAAGGDLTGTYPNPTLTATAVTAGNYGSATQVPVFTVDSKGRITGVTNTAITASPSGAAGGDLTGTYPNPTITANAVTTAKILDANITTAKILDANVTTAKLADGAVTTTKVSNGAITTAKISSSGATSGQGLTFDGSAIVWGSPSPSGAAGGDLTGTYPNPTIATNAVTTTKILDANVTTSKLADASVTTAKVNSTGATSGQALTFNGTSVVWGNPSPGGTAGGDLSGIYPNPNVVKLQGRDIASTIPTNGQALVWNQTLSRWEPATPSGGDVVGPSSATDNAISRFDATTGKLIQNSALIVDDYTTATQNNVTLRTDDGSTSNINLVLSPKGTGAIMADKPDGATNGGNARGQNSVDWQTSRSAGTQVASGNYSVISGGNGNTVTGALSSIVGGNNNMVSGDHAVVSGGNTNKANSFATAIGGGYLNAAEFSYGTIPGGYGMRLGSGAEGSFGFNGFSSYSDSAYVNTARTAYFGNVDLWLGNTRNQASKIRFYEAQSADGTFPASGTNYTAFVAGTQSVDITYTLPTAAATVNGQILSSTTGGALSWVTASVGDVVGPVSATDNAITRFDATTGKLIQNSAIIIDDFTTATQNNVTLRADDGSTGNIDLVLSPKGTGALVAGKPGSGANARGSQAVDWQISRSAATQVAAGDYSTIGGGRQNTAASYTSTVSGGILNSVTAGNYGVVSGGSGNTVSGSASNIGGGTSNTNSGTNSVIAGGVSNTNAGNYSTIGGGQLNNVSVSYTTVGGGFTNAATSNNATVSGGTNNTASGSSSVVSGGNANTASQQYAIVAGGNANQATGGSATVSGGSSNIASSGNSVISGGLSNTNGGDYSTIAGGRGLTLGSNADRTFGFHANNSGGSLPMTVDVADVAVFGNTNLWLANNDNSASELRFYEAYNTSGTFPNTANYTAFKAGTQTADITYTLPTAAPTVNGQVLSSTTGGAMSWITDNGGDVVGPASSVDNAISRFNTTTGKLIQNSAILIDDYTTTTQNNVTLRADDGSTGNIGLVLSPKGSGALTANKPDGGTTGGNARGNNAVDLQMQRTIATQVASGNGSFIGGGTSNTASGQEASVSGGILNVASGLRSSIGGGATNTAAGDYSSIPGGYLLTLTANADNSFGFLGNSTGGANMMTIDQPFTSVFGNTHLWLANNNGTASQIRFYEANSVNGTFPPASTNYTAFRAGTQAADVTYTLPTGAPTVNGQVLSSTTAGVMTWITDNGGDVVGPSSATDNAISRFDATTGKLIQNSAIIIDDFTAATQNNVTLRADDGSTTNIGLVLSPKGTGALTSDKPDGASGGGNARGSNAVDLQMSRSAATQVASGSGSFIGGGSNNTASGNSSTVNGGNNNTASVTYGTVGGGNSNTASTGAYATVGGGNTNVASGGFAPTVAGGNTNTASGQESFVGGGFSNTASALYSTVTGGTANIGSGNNSTVGGGNTNQATSSNTTVSGGQNNTSSSSGASIGGGTGNTASGSASVVDGGTNNTASGVESSIGGGITNVASGDRSAIGGGVTNTAAGDFSAIPGGHLLTITTNADYSFGFLANGGGGVNAMTLDQPSTALFGNANLWLANNNSAASQLRFYEANGANGIFPPSGVNYTAFQAGSQAADVTYTLPSAAPTSNGQTLVATTAGVMSWVTGNAGDVVGPASSTDNAITRFDATTGKLIQNSAIIVDDYDATTQSNVTLRADDGGTPNINLVLASKGTGAITAGKPDGTTTGGNARGSNAVDWQMTRTANTQVASGLNAVIGGGTRNTASAPYSFIGGGYSNTTSTNDYATVAGGFTNTATGHSSFIGGGQSNNASATSATVAGGQNNLASGSGDAVSGGTGNTASGTGSVVTGGTNNIASGLESSVNGGITNVASGDRSAVGGGVTNTAAGDFSAIPGGHLLTITANADYSFGFLANGGGGVNAMTLDQPSTALFGNANLWLANNNSAASQLRFYEANGANGTFPPATINYTAFQAGAQTADVTYTLPTGAPSSNGQVLTSTTGGVMSWTTVSGGDVVGPASATDNAISRFDATTGKLIQNSAIIVDDFTSTTQNNVTLRADDGSTANIDLVLSAKGTGAISAQKPDGTTTGGNARGNYTIDWQRGRNLAAQVASNDYATIGGGRENTASGSTSTVAGGILNTTSNNAAFIGGGWQNVASGFISAISGGYRSTASGTYSSVGGGNTNTASGQESFVGGGSTNSASATGSTISGGNNNVASTSYSTVGGGNGNTASTGTYATVSGGNANIASGTFASTVAGGNTNTASGQESFVGGGFSNTASALYSTVTGGTANLGSGNNSTIGGGHTNQATSSNTTVSGGQNNTSSNSGASIGGGTGNTASGSTSVVAGGNNNTSSNQSSTVSGGSTNSASGIYCTVGGGNGNRSSGFASTVGGGINNLSDYSYTTIPGGYGMRLGNSAEGSFGFNGFTTYNDSAYVNTPRTAYFGNVDLWLGNTRGIASQMRFYTAQTSDGTFPAATTYYSAFQAGAQTGNLTYTLPIVAPIAGQVLSSTSAGVLSWATAAGLTNFTESVNTTAPNTTVPVVRLLATNAASDVDIALSPKGNGALTAQVADNSGIGGNKRGVSAVDWQLSRSVNTHVASGNYSTIGGGYDNTAGGGFAAVVGGGSTNVASADGSLVSGGTENTASNTNSTVGGGLTNTSSGVYSTIAGGSFNNASGFASTVGGGQDNTSESSSTTIPGGYGMRLGVSALGSFGYNGYSGSGDDTAYVNSPNTAYFGNVDLWLGNTRNQASQLRFYTAQPNDGTFPVSGTYYTAFRAGTQTADITYTLPTDAPSSNGQVLSSTTGGVLSWASASGLTNFTESVNTTTPNGTIPVVQLLATNAATDVDIALTPKGGGALTAQVADNTTTGGNKRGTGAVDWQMARTANTQVASQAYSTIGGGTGNTATGGSATVAGGNSNTATGNLSSVTGGGSNTAGGTNSSVLGGFSNTANGFSSSITGGNSNFTAGDYSTVLGGRALSLGAAADGSIGFLSNISGTNDMTITSASTAVFGNTNLWLANNNNNASELRFYEPNATTGTFPPASIYYTAFKAGDQTGNLTYTLPVTAPTDGQVLSSTAGGVMSWTSPSLTYFTESLNTTAPNNLGVPVVQLLATYGAATNVDVALSPKGAGALTAQVADNAPTGGNKRGAHATDWQSERFNASEVASANYSTVSGGVANTASGYISTVSGGYQNTNGGDYSAILGGRGLTFGANADHSVGYLANTSGNEMTINTSNTAVFGNTNLWLANNNGTASEIRFYEVNNTSSGTFPPAGTNYVAFKAGVNVSADNTYTLPTAYPTGGTGRQLTSTTAGTMSWGAQTLQVSNYNIDCGNLAADGGTAYVNVVVTGAVVGGTVTVSPRGDMEDGIIIAFARVDANDNVRIKFVNATGGAVDPAAINVDVTVVQP